MNTLLLVDGHNLLFRMFFGVNDRIIETMARINPVLKELEA